MTEKRKTPAGNEEEYRDFNPENYIPAEDARQRERYIPFPQYQTVAEEASFYPSQTASDATGNSTEVTTHAEQPEQNASIAAETSAKRASSKQRKLSLEEYRTTYLQVPRIEDRKPVFVSREVRDTLDGIVRRLGGRRMSVSGLLENMARQHIATYQYDIKQWRKL